MAQNLTRMTQPFSTEFLQTIETLLKDLQVRLNSELSNLSQKNSSEKGDLDASFPKYGDEEDDNAREVADYTTNKTLEITLEKTKIDVQKALERLQKGTYGICKYCDLPIAEQRLLARPTSSACVSCKKTLTDEA